MVRVLLEQGLQDARGLKLVSEGFVGRHGGHVEHERVQDLCFVILGIAYRHTLHALFEGPHSRPIVHRLPFRKERGQRRNIVAFALALGAHAQCLRHGRFPCLRRVRVDGPAERIAHRHDGNAPIRHPALGVVFQDLGEGVLRRFEPEGVKHRHRPIELLLRGNIARDAKVNLPELLGRGSCGSCWGSVGVRLTLCPSAVTGDAEQGYQQPCGQSCH